MPISYTWDIVQMDCYPETGGHTDVVFEVHWFITGTDNGLTASIYGSQTVQLDLSAPYTPYADLTQSQVLGWVHGEMGAERVAELKNNIAAQIAALANPPVINPPLPWME